MSLADLRNLAVAVRRGRFALAALLAFAAFGWAEAPDVAPSAGGGEPSAEAAPAGVEGPDEGDAEPAAQPEEETPAPEPEPEAKKDGPVDVFVPSESISEDISLPFPADI